MPQQSLEIEVFRAGDYGPKGAYDEASLDRLAEDYDPAWHEAPVTLDHQSKGPAFGWVGSLERQGDRLVARLHSLSAELLGLLRDGAYKKRSIELYRQFERTGRPYLRAVSFLGACPPEVKGLADPVFADSGPAVEIAFSAGGEPEGGEPGRRVRQREIEAQCQAWEREGRFGPAQQALGVAGFMAALDGAPPIAVCGDSGAPGDALEWFKAFVDAMPCAAFLGEAAPEPPRLPSRAAFEESLPFGGGSRMDEESLRLHRAAFRLREASPALSYAEALRQAALEASGVCRA